MAPVVGRGFGAGVFGGEVGRAAGAVAGDLDVHGWVR